LWEQGRGAAREGLLGAMPLNPPPSKIFENRDNVQKNNAIFAQFLPHCHFLFFFARNFPEGVIIVPKMPELTITNKFQFHTYFRFG